MNPVLSVFPGKPGGVRGNALTCHHQADVTCHHFEGVCDFTDIAAILMTLCGTNLFTVMEAI